MTTDLLDGLVEAKLTRLSFFFCLKMSLFYFFKKSIFFFLLCSVSPHTRLSLMIFGKVERNTKYSTWGRGFQSRGKSAQRPLGERVPGEVKAWQGDTSVAGVACIRRAGLDMEPER